MRVGIVQLGREVGFQAVLGVSMGFHRGRGELGFKMEVNMMEKSEHSKTRHSCDEEALQEGLGSGIQRVLGVQFGEKKRWKKTEEVRREESGRESNDADDLKLSSNTTSASWDLCRQELWEGDVKLEQERKHLCKDGCG